jgi:glycosyltransferase involved in cell wall biosynthesis
MPCLNSVAFVGDAIRSVLQQRGPAWELLIQDAGSTDGTLDVIRELADERVHLVSEPDGGQSDGLNRAVARARGEWIVWLNADDTVAPGAFAAVLPNLVEPYDLVYGDFQTVDAQGRVTKLCLSGPLTKPRLLRKGCFVFSGSIYYRRRLLEETGPFDARLDCCMDFDYLLRAIQHARPFHVHIPLARYRVHAGTKTNTRFADFKRESFQLRRRWAAGSPQLAAAAALGMTRMQLYGWTRRLWLSPVWLRLKPTTRL